MVLIHRLNVFAYYGNIDFQMRFQLYQSHCLTAIGPISDNKNTVLTSIYSFDFGHM